MTSRAIVVCALWMCLSASAIAADDSVVRERPLYRIARVHGEFHIDGVTNEEGWKEATLLELGYETKPAENIPARNRTEFLIGYDDSSIYIAFRAFVPDPEKTRAHFTDRDQAFSDDFVGVALDTFNDERRAFEFFVNPLGVQMDVFNDDVVQNEDSSWDTIWYSAGKIHSEGYTVEMMIPLRSLRFPDTSGEQTWGIDALRYHQREYAYRYGLVPQDRGLSCYLCQSARIQGFEGISPGRNLELSPTFTANRSERMQPFPDGDFQDDHVAEPGLTATWGITPNWTMNATGNPDFSQVEADAAQLDINTQFALFFPEKRPFFLEGADFFDTPMDVVFTRNVADPILGAKVTGKSGQNVGAAFFAEDEITNLVIPGSQRSRRASLDRKSADTVLRYRRDIGENSTLGALISDREADDYYNRVLGADGTFRFADSDTVQFQLLGSQTRYPDAISSGFQQPFGSFDGHALLLNYEHESRNWLWFGEYEDLGRDFRADMGFIPQVDFRRYVVGGGRTWHGESDRNWYSRIFLGSDFDDTRDQAGNLIERELEVFLEANGPMQSFFFVGPGVRERVFNGVSFDQAYVNGTFEINPTGSLYAKLEARFGDELDFANTRNGKVKLLIPGIKYRWGRHLQLQLDHTFQKLGVENGSELFTANLTEARITYQLNIRTFVRWIAQYTSINRDPDLYIEPVKPETRMLFNQVLFSYKINPQTVLFLGYSDNHLGEYGIDLTQTDRTIFFKVGYAWRM